MKRKCLKRIPLGKENVTKNTLYFFSRPPTYHSFTINLRFLYELQLNFNKKYRLFYFKMSYFLSKLK